MTIDGVKKMSSNDDVLNVWYGEDLIGKLWRDPIGRIGFQYHKAWQQKGFALSLTKSASFSALSFDC